MRRLLLLLLAVVALFWWLGRLLARARGAARPARRPVSGPPQGRGTMVRDRVCNTFLPRSRALVASVDGEDHFFCSEKCREAYLAGRELRSGTGR